MTSPRRLAEPAHRDQDEAPEPRGMQPPRSLEGSSLKRYAMRLSEVVMQQHAARRQDWSNFQATEQLLSEQVQSLRQKFESELKERDEAVGREVIMEQELRAERRRRIELEAKITLVGTWKEEALAADRALRTTSTNTIMQVNAESEAAREWKRQAAEARRGE
eukprot:TRINITY_DN32302_c0_g1_i1.p1 TRINITY_DN32302_c0_g1~~TRINITY_DN32302_c0_g1_i1.p1  ORF type:complete len:163 (-),score=44.85 TRINITY_DN32302_c0_g1_i1:281-769(-)